MRSLSGALKLVWQQRTFVAYLLWPISMLYRVGFTLRRWCYQYGLFSVQRFHVPVIVVGNITVGGSGKTPIVCAIVRQLEHRGWRPGIVSRGYRGNAQSWPQVVTPHSSAQVVGDEPVLLARRTQRPVVVGPDRPAAVRLLLDSHSCDVVVADDGLQHLALYRDIEIAVVDGERRFGNGFCLPAGPLREPSSRLDSVDFVIVNSGNNNAFSCRLTGPNAVNLIDPTMVRALRDFRERKVHAVAGIGNPNRFFKHLRSMHLDLVEHAFGDHHSFQRSDFNFSSGSTILMTEKDAVKCTAFAEKDMWYVPVTAELDEKFYNQLIERLQTE